MMATLNCKGQLLDLSRPVVMGILNLTPDSFYDGGLYQQQEQALNRVGEMIAEGATIIDVGGASSRPGAETVSVEDELKRIIPVIEAIKKQWPDQIISVDTWRSAVAERAVRAGASIVNDVTAGMRDPAMFSTVAACRVPYILMHIQGTPDTMQLAPHYENITLEVLDFFIAKVNELREKGVSDIVIDPGFGFGKTVQHNYTLFRTMDQLVTVLGLPLLVGVSRKSMIYKLLQVDSTQALNASTALHALALDKGACILRVHDVREAVETIKIWTAVQGLE